jgi:hypothetical protein
LCGVVLAVVAHAGVCWVLGLGWLAQHVYSSAFVVIRVNLNQQRFLLRA